MKMSEIIPSPLQLRGEEIETGLPTETKRPTKLGGGWSWGGCADGNFRALHSVAEIYVQGMRILRTSKHHEQSSVRES